MKNYIQNVWDIVFVLRRRTNRGILLNPDPDKIKELFGLSIQVTFYRESLFSFEIDYLWDE